MSKAGVEIHFRGRIYKTIKHFCQAYKIKYNDSVYRDLKKYGAEELVKRRTIPRQPKVRIFHHNGKEITVRDMVNMTGLSKSTIDHRLRLGWSVERILKNKQVVSTKTNFKWPLPEYEEVFKCTIPNRFKYSKIL